MPRHRYRAKACAAILSVSFSTFPAISRSSSRRACSRPARRRRSWAARVEKPAAMAIALAAAPPRAELCLQGGVLADGLGRKPEEALLGHGFLAGGWCRAGGRVDPADAVPHFRACSAARSDALGNPCGPGRREPGPPVPRDEHRPRTGTGREHQAGVGPRQPAGQPTRGTDPTGAARGGVDGRVHRVPGPPAVSGGGSALLGGGLVPRLGVGQC